MRYPVLQTPLLLVWSFLLWNPWNGLAVSADPPSLPTGFQLVYQQDFLEESSLKELTFSDPKAWKWTPEGKSGGGVELFKQSEYKTEHRSPFNLAILADKQFGDFILELDMKQTGKEYGHRDMCLFFGLQNRSQFYYTHLATTPDPNAHNIFLVDNAPRKSFLEIPKKGVDWGDDWKHIRLQRIGKKIEVFFEDMMTPVLQGEHERFNAGAIGFGSFDDVGKMDNLKIWSPKMETNATPIFNK